MSAVVHNRSGVASSGSVAVDRVARASAVEWVQKPESSGTSMLSVGSAVAAGVPVRASVPFSLGVGVVVAVPGPERPVQPASTVAEPTSPAR